jgi:hypothetical protein
MPCTKLTWRGWSADPIERVSVTRTTLQSGTGEHVGETTGKPDSPHGRESPGHGILFACLGSVAWDLDVSDDFEQWWTDLHEEEQVAVDAMLRLLETFGSGLGPPYSRAVEGQPHLRELRIRHHRQDIDVLYFCYPWRSRVVLLSGAIRNAREPRDAAQREGAQNTLAAHLGVCERQAS